MKTYVHFLLLRRLNSHKHCLRMKWYKAVRIALELQTLGERVIMLRYTYVAHLLVSRCPLICVERLIEQICLVHLL